MRKRAQRDHHRNAEHLHVVSYEIEVNLIPILGLRYKDYSVIGLILLNGIVWMKPMNVRLGEGSRWMGFNRLKYRFTFKQHRQGWDLDDVRGCVHLLDKLGL
jgi:hypothetical protein